MSRHLGSHCVRVQQQSGHRASAARRHAWCRRQRMLYTTLGVVVLAVVAAVIVQRAYAKRSSSRKEKETERDIERAEGEGMVAQVASAT